MPVEYTPQFRIAMLGPGSVVSDIKKASREQALSLEAALASRIAPPNLSELNSLISSLNTTNKTVDGISSKVSTLEKNSQTTNSSVTSLAGRVTKLEAAPTTGVLTPMSGWTLNTGSTPTVIRDNATGMVFATIDATCNTAIPNGATVCTLPAGLRPPSTMTLSGVQSEGGGSGPLTFVIGSAGDVKVWPGTTTNKRAGIQMFWRAA